MIEGRAAVAAACAAGVALEVFVDDDRPDALPDGGVEVTMVEPDVLDRVLDTVNSQGIAAIAAIAPVSVEDLVESATAAGRPIVVLDRVADPGNAGTIMRSATAAGAAGVVATAGTVDLWSPKVVRSAAGASFELQLALVEHLAAVGLPMVGTSSHQGVSHVEADLAGSIALVIGNEAAGLSDDHRDIDSWVRIDMDGPAESLNAAMAATVLLFEARRQRVALG